MEHGGAEIERGAREADRGGKLSSDRRPGQHAGIEDGIEQSHSDRPRRLLERTRRQAHDRTGGQAAKDSKSNDDGKHRAAS